MIDYAKKAYKIAAIALIFAIIGWVLPTSITSTNQTLGLNIVLNNTNLAPTIEPSEPGTGERINNVTYWNNNSDIEIHVFAHAMNTSQTAETFLYINGTLVSPRSGRPLGAAETAYRGVDTIIPRGSFYRVLFTNYHHYEWREYQILSGNLTSNITSSSCVGCVNQTQLNEKVNITTNGTTTITSINNTGVFSSITLEPNLLQLEAGNGGTSMINMNQNLINIAINGGNSILFEELLTTSYNDINMSNKSILDCANCQVTGHGLARAYLNTTVLNISDATLTHIVLNKVSYNPYAEFNTTTGNYTVSADGYYDIFSVANYGGVIANKKYSTLVYSNGIQIMASSGHSSTTLSLSTSQSDTRLLHAGDNIALYAFPQTGSNTTSISSGESVTWMSISLKSKVPP